MERPNIESMNLLGKALAATEGVRVGWGEAGILIGDSWHEPVPLNQYLGALCSSSEKVFFTPTKEQRDVLVLAIGRTISQDNVLARSEVITDEVQITNGVDNG
ncbi:MAG: hypothetical protein M3Q70_02165 [bacterium]|nr:hypothetical protein [bacterium]